MKHCHSTVYYGDEYCGDCGETLTTKPLRHNVGELCPELFEDIKKYYPDAYAITGQVLESRLYKRFSSGSSRDLEYSYWWIKLESNTGEIIETSISAESKYTETIGRGDVLTLYYPTGMTLYHKIKGRDARSFVSHNKSVPCVVVHADDGQRYTVEDIYPAPVQKSAWLWVLVGICVAIFMYVSQGHASDALWIVSIAVALMTLYFEIKRNKAKFEYASEKYDALQASFKKMLNVTKLTLGYSNLSRNQSASDVICIQCHTRLPSDLAFCISCGTSNVPHVQGDTIEPEQHELSAENEAMPVAMNASSPTTISVDAIQQQLASHYLFSSQNNYLHKHSLVPDRNANVKNEFILAKVVSTDVSNKVSDVTTVTTTTTETKHYRGSHYQYSTYDTKEDRYRKRTSTLRGKVLLEYINGDTCEFRLREDILGAIDVGDWIAIADTETEFEDERDYVLEYVYNITKSKRYNCESFQSYSDNRGTSRWWLVTIGCVIAAIVAAFMSVAEVAILIGGFYVLFNLYVWTRSFINSGSNARQRKAILAPLKERISRFESSLEKLQKQLKILG